MKRLAVPGARWIALLLALGCCCAAPIAASPKRKGSRMSAITWGDAVGGLRLGVSTDTNVVRVHLENVGKEPLDVLSHVLANEVHLDWYLLHLEDEKGQARLLRLWDDRDESGAVRVRLEPGARIKHDVDVVSWSARPINGEKTLAPGSYKVRASYNVQPGRNTWTGRLEAGPVTLKVSARAASAG